MATSPAVSSTGLHLRRTKGSTPRPDSASGRPAAPLYSLPPGYSTRHSHHHSRRTLGTRTPAVQSRLCSAQVRPAEPRRCETRGGRCEGLPAAGHRPSPPWLPWKGLARAGHAVTGAGANLGVIGRSSGKAQSPAGNGPLRGEPRHTGSGRQATETVGQLQR